MREIKVSDDAAFGFSGPVAINGVKYFNVNGEVVSTTPLHALQGINL